MRINKYDEFDMNEGYAETLKLVVSSIKNATDEEIEKISQILRTKLTWGNIKDIADVMHVEIQK